MRQRICMPLAALLLTGSIGQAAQRITAQITLTNAPSHNDTITVNSDPIRYWVTNIVSDSTNILIGADVGLCATNCATQAARNPYSGPIITFMSDTNIVELMGQIDQSMSVTLGGAWGAVGYSTNTIGTAKPVLVPGASMPSQDYQTNLLSLLASDLSSYSTNAIASASTLMMNFVTLNTTQTGISGPKEWIGSNHLSQAVIEDLTVFPTPISSPGGGSYSEQFGTGANAATNYTTAIGYNAAATASAAVALGSSASATGIDATAIDGTASGQSSITIGGEVYGDYSVSLGSASEISGTNSVAIGDLSAANYNNSVAIGSGVSTTTTNEIRLGTTSQTTQIPGDLIVGGDTTLAGLYATGINATATMLTNGLFINPTLTNAVNKGSPFESYNGADTTTLQLSASASASGEGATAVGYGAQSSGTNSVALGNAPIVSGQRSTALGSDSTVIHDDSTALGESAATTDDNQIRLGTAAESVSVPGSLSVAGNAKIGDDWETTFPTSMAHGIWIDEGTAATADPATGASIWADAGELQYRTSAAGEGSGATNRAHNRGTETIGSGSDYTLTGAYAMIDFGGTDPEFNTLPSAGTYLMTASIEYVSDAAGSGDEVRFRWYNVTGAADVANSEIALTSIANSAIHHIVLWSIVTVTSGDRLRLEGYNVTSARGTVTSTRTKIGYMRLF